MMQLGDDWRHPLQSEWEAAPLKPPTLKWEGCVSETPTWGWDIMDSFYQSPQQLAADSLNLWGHPWWPPICNCMWWCCPLQLCMCVLSVKQKGHSASIIYVLWKKKRYEFILLQNKSQCLIGCNALIFWFAPICSVNGTPSYIAYTFTHLVDALIQSDLQVRDNSKASVH